MRDVVNTLMREPHECLAESTHVYLRDLYDHTVQIMEIIESLREMAADLADTYMTSVYAKPGQKIADGANLSPGQRQLLAIARTAVSDPPVMILDEATNSSREVAGNWASLA